jgi:hypothetical protein
MSNQKEDLIFNMVCWVDNQWMRELQRPQNIFEREEALNLQLLQLLNLFQLSEQEDFWQRRGNVDDRNIQTINFENLS